MNVTQNETTPDSPPTTLPESPAAPSVRTWDRRLQQAVIIVGRLMLAYLFFSNLWWKLPPTFSCTNNFAFPTANAAGHPDGSKSNGLCYWIGVEAVYANQPRNLFVADMRYANGPTLQVDIVPLAKLNGWVIETIIKPNITWFGYLIFGAEALIFITMFLGLFSRLGGLVAIGVSAQLMIGLANIPQPYEWEWGYNLMVMLSLLMFGLAPGRYLGIDALLRPPLLRAAARGNILARLVSALT